MDVCNNHSGMCQNVENIKDNCTEYRAGFDKKLDKIDNRVEAVSNKFDALRTLLITVLVGVVVNLALLLLQNADKLFAFYYGLLY
ncbi:MAG TPA: hypothetical protein HA367_01260 [Candidatus Methanofastidiosum sp.]|nr:hypothetical protein [Methanofastidiosum sp.]